jgi:hypothetical protein
MVRVPLPASTSSNVGLNLLSRSRIRNLKWPARTPGSMSKLRACWMVHAPVGLAVTPGMCTRRGLDLHHEEDVQASEEHGVGVQEVARQDPGRLEREIEG